MSPSPGAAWALWDKTGDTPCQTRPVPLVPPWDMAGPCSHMWVPRQKWDWAKHSIGSEVWEKKWVRNRSGGSPVEATTVKQLNLHSPWRRPHWSRHSDSSHQRIPCYSRWVFSEGAVRHVEPMESCAHEERFFLKDCSPWKDLHWSRLKAWGERGSWCGLTTVLIPHPSCGACKQ